MHKRSIRVAVMAVAILSAIAGADRASAGGVKIFSACQTLSDFNTVYKLATDLGSCGDCLFVTNSKITIDLQGHSIASTCPSGGKVGAAITDDFAPLDLITVKNGSIIGYDVGVLLAGSSRASVLGVKTKNHSFNGVWLGAHGLVKFTESSGNSYGIEVGAYGQVQQSNAHDNEVGILAIGDNCLITGNTANSNGAGIETSGDKCTVSYNTANDNRFFGILAGVFGIGTGHLITQNVALHNGTVEFGEIDFAINCPSTRDQQPLHQRLSRVLLPQRHRLSPRQQQVTPPRLRARCEAGESFLNEGVRWVQRKRGAAERGADGDGGANLLDAAGGEHRDVERPAARVELHGDVGASVEPEACQRR
jgi:parallel beta-helix repeat protein